MTQDTRTMLLHAPIRPSRRLLVALVNAALVHAALAQANEPQPAPDEPRASSATPAPRPFLRSAIPQPSPTTPPNSTGAAASSGWMRTTGALAAVVALILLLAWGYRAAVGPAVIGRSRRPELIDVLSRTALSPRHSLALVRVGPRLVLLGYGPDGVRSLDVIAQPDVVAKLCGDAAQRKPDANSSAFDQVLTAESAQYPRPDDAQPPAGDEAERLAHVQSVLSAAARRLERIAKQPSL